MTGDGEPETADRRLEAGGGRPEEEDRRQETGILDAK